MIVTEEEAKTKRCQESYPACREVSPEGHHISASTGGGYATQTAPSFCIGSACMAWRWMDQDHQDKGYCGKAGRPSP